MSVSDLTRIAIVGMGGVFPDAENLKEFWKNIINKKVSVYETPEKYRSRGGFYDKAILGSSYKEDKTYSNICSYINNFQLDSVRFRIPPAVLKQMDPDQKAALYAADCALKEVATDHLCRDRVAVFMGDGSYSLHHINLERRLYGREILRQMEMDGSSEEEREAFKKKFLDNLPPITEDSAPGTLRNIIAARIASVFDFHGPSYTVNSACASGLTAVIRGVEGLRSGAFDAVVCGATDMDISDSGFAFFSAINALSPNGAYPFDERADGFVIGQGAGVVVLKRVEDALRDGDKIYALVAGYGQASDGRGKAIAAPEKKWQSHTVVKALKSAGYSPDTVEYIEAHGTGTKVGDVVEVAALKDAFSKSGSQREGFCGLSTVKSNIGHLKSAAGIAGLIKAALAIHHKILPPVASFQKVNPALELEDSPFYIINEARPWKSKEHPRRAGVSAFGFGGADYHIALEEFKKEDRKKSLSYRENSGRKLSSEQDGYTFFLSGNSREEIFTLLNRASDLVVKSSVAEAAALCYKESDVSHKCRLAFEVISQEEFFLRRDTFQNIDDVKTLELKGVYYNEGPRVKPSEMALMFPGQASQYGDMLSGLSSLPVYSKTVAKADSYTEKLRGFTVSGLISSDKKGKNETEEQLKLTENTHPALFTTSLALFAQLESQGLKARYMIGHSLGEISALTASGVTGFTEGLRLALERGYAFENSSEKGAMAAVQLSLDECRNAIESYGKGISIANINGPEQIIVSGKEADVKVFCEKLSNGDVKNSLLKVSRAFHSPLVQKAEEIFSEKIDNMDFSEPLCRVCCNHRGGFYPDNPDGVKEYLKDQITGHVDFVSSVRTLSGKGVKLFVEVGPGSVLNSLVKKILPGEEVSVFSANYKNKEDLVSYNRLLCALFSRGIDIHPIVQSPSEKTVEKKSEAAIVFSGVSVGLPGSDSDTFSDDNIHKLFRGENLIEKLTDEEKQKMVDLNVSKLIKSENGASFKMLSSLNEVIQLAGKAGNLDLREYLVDEKDMRNMSSAISLAVAAGYEALRDSHIPLVREMKKTASGKLLPGRWVLPEYMQEDTGIIFATGFPLVDPVIAEVSRYIASAMGGRMKEELIEFYESIISRVSDLSVKKQLTDWFASHYSRLSSMPGENEVYQFNHHFITQISAQANNRLASYINARGPNLSMNAACSSTSAAISIAEDYIKTGRVKRMLVIGGDDPTAPDMMPLLGSGFACTGAATTEGDVTKAALPFDKRRNGMIMGSGAVGIILETREETENRGIRPLCDLLGTSHFNAAGHVARIEYPHFITALNKLISETEKRYRVHRKDIASSLVYMSHETYTPAKGGCSQTEAITLRSVFKNDYKQILVTNTKGMTGHTMGASIEDAVAARSLQYGKCPPVVNYEVPDPELEGLRLSRGENHNCEYALKMAAGFGGQGNYILLRKVSSGDDRILSESVYSNWLKEVSGQEAPEVVSRGRVLVIDDGLSDNAAGKKKRIKTKPEPQPVKEARDEILKVFSEVTGYPVEMLDDSMEMEADLGIDTVKQATILAMLSDLYRVESRENFRLSDYPSVGHIIKLYSGLTPSGQMTEGPGQPEEKSGCRDDEEILKVFSEVTGYPVEMLDRSMEMEADLGIDTVKQATILAMLSDLYGAEDREDFKLSDYPTIGHIIDLYGGTRIAVREHVTEERGDHQPSLRASDEVEILKVFSEVTGYPVEMLDRTMEMEADLGIDTVKQATILAMLSDLYGAEDREDFKLSDYPTIGHIMDLYIGNPVSEAIIKSEKICEKQLTFKGSDEEEILKVFSEVTGYPVEMLDRTMEMEADLGIDTVKQATILAMLSDLFKVEDRNDFKLSDYPSIGHIVDLYARKGAAENVQDSEIKTVKQPFSKGSDEDEILKVFSEVTGYPEEMLDLSMEMEADLGIDTVKQATILAMLSDLFKVEDRNDFKLSDYPTIGHIVELYSGNNSVSCDAKAASSLNGGDRGETEITRQVVSWVETPLKKGRISLKGKRVLLTGGALPENMIKALTDAGSEIMCEETEGFKGLDFVIDYADFSPFQPGDEFTESVQNAGSCRFDLYKRVQEQDVVPKRILCITNIDGKMGYAKGHNSPFTGAVTGFYKALRKEWSQSDIRLVDMDVFQEKLILQELKSTSTSYEIGYYRKKRYAAVLENREAEGETFQLDNKSVYLVTGGGSGITGELIKGLAREKGGRFALVGRTSLPDNIADLSALSEEELEGLKGIIHNRLSRTESRVTPVMMERELNSVKRAVSVYQNMEKIRSAGAEVLYFNGDVTDKNSLAEIVSSVKKSWGSIDGIIHGAGVDIGHFLENKSREEFDLVYNIKAEGAMNLSEVCREEPLKLAVAMGSVAGRFGSGAQLDYSAGNDFLSSWTLWLREHFQNIKTLCFCWSGWSEVGIAWRNSYLRANSEAMGLNLIDPDSGVNAFLRELSNDSDHHEIVLHRGLGDLIEEGQAIHCLSQKPLIDRVKVERGHISRIYRNLSVHRDEFMKQHRLGDTPLMPAVSYMELCSEYLSLLEGPQKHFIIRDLDILGPLKLFREESKEIYAEARECHDGEWQMELAYRFAPGMSRDFQDVPFARLRIAGGTPSLTEFHKEAWEPGVCKKHNILDYLSSDFSRSQKVNFGPLYQDLMRGEQSPGSREFFTGSEGVVYPVTFPREFLSNEKYELNHYLINPCMIDSIFQGAALYCLTQSSHIHLPCGAEEFGFVNIPESEDDFRVYVRFREERGDELVFDSVMVNSSDEINYYAKGVRMKRING